MIFPSTSIAVSSWTWHDSFYKGELNLVEIPAKARAAGINQVELNDFMLPPGRWSRTRKLFRTVFGYEKRGPKQQRYIPSTINELINQLKTHEVTCISWSIESDLTVSEDQWRKELAYIIKGMQTAAQLNAEMIRLTIGGSERMDADIDHKVIRRLKLIAALCQRLFPTIQPVVENHWGLTTDINRFLKILAAVPSIKTCFDPGNIPSNDRELAWQNLAVSAHLFHLKIIEHHPDKLDSDIDYQTVFKHLINNKYAGKIVIEYEGNQDPAETLKEVQAQLNKWPIPDGYEALLQAENDHREAQQELLKDNQAEPAASFLKSLIPGHISLDNQT